MTGNTSWSPMFYVQGEMAPMVPRESQVATEPMIIATEDEPTTVTIGFKLFESSLQGWIYLKSNLVTMTQGNKA